MTIQETLQKELSGMSVMIPPVLIPHVHQAMKNFAEQEKAAERERIKKDIKNFCDSGNVTNIYYTDLYKLIGK